VADVVSILHCVVGDLMTDILSTPETHVPVTPSVVGTVLMPETVSPRYPVESPLPASGGKVALQTIIRTAGWVTKPIWWPVYHGILDVLRLKMIVTIPMAIGNAMAAQGKRNAALWDSWTPEERKKVQKQKFVWYCLGSAGVLLAIFPGSNLLLHTCAFAWVAKNHNVHYPSKSFLRKIVPLKHRGKLIPHWDLARWILDMPQVPEHVLAGLLSPPKVPPEQE